VPAQDRCEIRRLHHRRRTGLASCGLQIVSCAPQPRSLAGADRSPRVGRAITVPNPLIRRPRRSVTTSC